MLFCVQIYNIHHHLQIYKTNIIHLFLFKFLVGILFFCFENNNEDHQYLVDFEYDWWLSFIKIMAVKLMIIITSQRTKKPTTIRYIRGCVTCKHNKKIYRKKNIILTIYIIDDDDDDDAIDIEL